MSLLSMSVLNVRCDATTNEIDRDEPYVLVTSVDLSNPLIPGVDVFKYGPWADINKGDVGTTLPVVSQAQADGLAAANLIPRVPFWGLAWAPRAITATTSVIFVVSLIEHDASADPNAARSLVKGMAVASVGASMTLPYATRVQKLLTDVRGAVQIPTGGPNFDDPIGTQQLVLVAADLSGAAGTFRNKVLNFAGEGADYAVTIQIRYS